MKKIFFTFLLLISFSSAEVLAGPCGTANPVVSSGSGSGGASGGSSGTIACGGSGSGSSGSAACPTGQYCSTDYSQCLPTGTTCAGGCRSDPQDPNSPFVPDIWFQYSPTGGYEYEKCNYAFNSQSQEWEELTRSTTVVNETPCECGTSWTAQDDAGHDVQCVCGSTDPACSGSSYNPSASSSSSSSSSGSGSSGGSGGCPAGSGYTDSMDQVCVQEGTTCAGGMLTDPSNPNSAVVPQPYYRLSPDPDASQVWYRYMVYVYTNGVLTDSHWTNMQASHPPAACASSLPTECPANSGFALPNNGTGCVPSSNLTCSGGCRQDPNNPNSVAPNPVYSVRTTTNTYRFITCHYNPISVTYEDWEEYLNAPNWPEPPSTPSPLPDSINNYGCHCATPPC